MSVKPVSGWRIVTGQCVDVLAIVVVNYKTAQLTMDCLRSVDRERENGTKLEVYLVDNASPDDSREVLEHFVSESGTRAWVNVINAPRNGGFAYGNNSGFRLAYSRNAERKYFLLLNPDTIVHPGAIDRLIEFMEANPKVGIAGSRLEDPDGTPQESAFRFPTLASELADGLRLGIVSRLLRGSIVAPPVQDHAHRTDWVAGASMIVRREVFDQIGLLDEKYFMYYEEVDFCRRTQQAGWECWYVPTSRVIHLVGQSSGINSADKKPKRRPAYVFESRRRYFQKHHGRFYAILADLAWLGMYPLWRFRRLIQRKPDTDPPHLWWDTLRHSSLFHGIEK